VLSLSRELIESDGDKSRYPTISLYADWSLHAQLDRKNAKQTLKRIQDAIDRDFAGERVDFVAEVSRILGMAELRAELRALFSKHSLPLFLVDSYSNWRAFGSKILSDLLQKPLIASEFTEEELLTGWGRTARQLRLIESAPTPGSQIQWQLTLGPRVTVVGNLDQHEGRSSFKSD
jgi:hypothetical protein